MISSSTIRSFLTVVAMATFLPACKDMGGEPPVVPLAIVPPSTVSFQRDVKTILSSARAGCTGCHGGTNGLYLDTRTDLLRGGQHGPAITPGNSAGSLLVKKISQNPPFGDRMPQGGFPLSDASIQMIKDWIDQGALDN